MIYAASFSLMFTKFIFKADFRLIQVLDEFARRSACRAQKNQQKKNATVSISLISKWKTSFALTMEPAQ